MTEWCGSCQITELLSKRVTGPSCGFTAGRHQGLPSCAALRARFFLTEAQRRRSSSKPISLPPAVSAPTPTTSSRCFHERRAHLLRVTRAFPRLRRHPVLLLQVEALGAAGDGDVV